MGRYILSLELHLVIAVVQLLVRPSDSSAGWSLSLTAIGAYGSCQVVSLSLSLSLSLSVFTRSSEADKAHQYANGSILESSATTSSNESVSKKREGTQRDIRATHQLYSLRGRSVSFAHAQLVVLDISQPEMQHRRRCACVCSLKESKEWNTNIYCPP